MNLVVTRSKSLKDREVSSVNELEKKISPTVLKSPLIDAVRNQFREHVSSMQKAIKCFEVIGPRLPDPDSINEFYPVVEKLLNKEDTQLKSSSMVYKNLLTLLEEVTRSKSVKYCEVSSVNDLESKWSPDIFNSPKMESTLSIFQEHVSSLDKAIQLVDEVGIYLPSLVISVLPAVVDMLNKEAEKLNHSSSVYKRLLSRQEKESVIRVPGIKDITNLEFEDAGIG